MRAEESRWSVIANGKAISNGTTYRHNGIISLTVTSQCKDTSPVSDDKEETKDDDDKLDLPATPVAKQPEACRFPPLRVSTSGGRGSNEALSMAIQQLGWRECRHETKSGPVDIYWIGLGFEEQIYNKSGVYGVNKLPGMVELAQKVHLTRIIKRMQLLFPGEFDFYPPTWFLPEQFHQFVAEVTSNKKTRSMQTATPRGTPAGMKRGDSPTYIVKPDKGSQGEGIQLVNDPRDVHDVMGSKPAIVQKYVANPILLDGYKFDLRMYVLVARLNPVEIYLCKDGLARLCTVAYEPPTPSNIHNTLMHLTNYSLNKYSDQFVHTSAEDSGSKRTYNSVRRVRSLRSQGYDVDKIHEQIVDVVVKTVLSLIPDVTIWDHVTNKSNLILGFDILMTSDEKAHLLEVNSSPSMCIEAEQTDPGSDVAHSVASPVDEQIKIPLLRDSLKLIAYGENEMDLSKSCLERIYPGRCSNPPPLRSKSSAFELLHHIKSRNASLNKVVEPKPSRTPQPHLPAKSIIGYHGNESGSPKRDEFENPLLNSTNLPSAMTSPKRPKRFTVIKYRQEYAITMEEWRLFGPRKQPASKTPKSPVSFQPTEVTQSPIKPHPPVGAKANVAATPCGGCGGLVGTTGLGLCSEQQLYKSSVDGGHVTPHVISDDVGEKSLDVINLQNWKTDSESDVRSDYDVINTPRRARMPARNIYFTSSLRHQLYDVTNPITSPSKISRCSNCDVSPLDDVINEWKERKDKFAIEEVTLLIRAAAIFIYFNGFKASLRIGATAFRNMARRCHLCDQGAMPAVDILFIDTMRQWQAFAEFNNSPFYETYKGKNPMTSHQPVGLPFQGFLEALFRLSKSRFRGSTLKERVDALITNCECYVTEALRADKIAKRRHLAKVHKKPITSPRLICSTSRRHPFF